MIGKMYGKRRFPRSVHGLSRRQLLEGMGLGGITMALPPLEAFGQTTTKKKLVVFYFGNGAPMDLWKTLSLPREGLGDMSAKCTVLRGVSNEELASPLIEQGANGHLA